MHDEDIALFAGTQQRLATQIKATRIPCGLPPISGMAPRAHRPRRRFGPRVVHRASAPRFRSYPVQGGCRAIVGVVEAWP
jgi:hypothetical protein